MGPPGWVTASAWTGFRPDKRAEEEAVEVTRSKVSDDGDGPTDPAAGLAAHLSLRNDDAGG
jgi:hypothetical protein